jgi:hypothetical protein
MKALSTVVRFHDDETWHLLQAEHLTCCGRRTWVDEPEAGPNRGYEATRQLIAMVRSADLCPKCQEALAKSKVSRKGIK